MHAISITITITLIIKCSLPMMARQNRRTRPDKAQMMKGWMKHKMRSIGTKVQSMLQTMEADILRRLRPSKRFRCKRQRRINRKPSSSRHWIQRSIHSYNWSMTSNVSHQNKPRKRPIKTEFDTDSFPIRIDTCSSYCMSPSKKDFVSELRHTNAVIRGIGGSVQRPMTGTLQWNWIDDQGNAVTAIIPNSLFFPTCPDRILSPQHWAQSRRSNGDPTTSCITTKDKTVLRWDSGTSSKTVPLNDSNVAVMMSSPGYRRAETYSAQLDINVDPEEIYAYSANIQREPGLIIPEPTLFESPISEQPTTLNARHQVHGLQSWKPTETVESQWTLSPHTVTFGLDKLNLQDPDDYDRESPENQQMREQVAMLHWHFKLNHLPFPRIRLLAKQGLLPARLAHAKDPKCAACLSGRATRRPWRTRAPPNNRPVPAVHGPGDCISVDQLQSTVPGLIAQLKGIPTKRRFKYATVFVDQFSNVSFVHLQETDSGDDTLLAKTTFELWAKSHGVLVRHYHADNGRFAESKWMNHCLRNAQTYSFCGVNAHHQNGVAERRIRTLQELARTMLIHAARRWPTAIEQHLWPYALRTANHVINSTPEAPSGLVPIEVFSQLAGTAAKLRDLHHFGCPAFVLDSSLQGGNKTTRHKWGDRSRVGINLGTSPNHPNSVALILNLRTGLVSPQFHVKYDDHFETVRDPTSPLPNSEWQWRTHFNPRRSTARTRRTGRIDDVANDDAQARIGGSLFRQRNRPQSQAGSANEPREEENELTDHHQQASAQGTNDQPQYTRYGREIRAPVRLIDGLLSLTNYTGINNEGVEQHPILAYAASADPDILYMNEAMGAPDAAKFKEAMMKEVRDHEKRNHWIMIPRESVPEDVPILPSVWAMRRKRRITTREVYKWKARLNLGGHKQEYGINYWETFAPVVTWPTIRMILTLSLLKGWKTKQIDFVLAYPQAEVQCELYMEIPQGFHFQGSRKSHVLKLLRNLYGQKQAGRVWYEHLVSTLKQLGFNQSEVDPCLFYRGKVIFLTFVDDCIATSPDELELEATIKDIQGELIMEDQGDLADYLGINISKLPEGGYHLSQPHLIQSILDELGLKDDSKSATTPALSTQILHADEDGEPFDGHFDYRRLIGKLNYLEKSSRPEIAFAVHQCARFSAAPKKSHAKAVRRIGQYLLATKERGYCIKPEGEEFEVSADASYCGEWESSRSYEAMTDSTMAKSRTGYGISFAQCIVTWQSKLQTEVTLSTTEAEFVALSAAAREAIYLMRLMDELRSNNFPIMEDNVTLKCTIKEDNSGAYELAKENKFRPRTRHINAKYWHFLGWLQQGRIKVEQVPTMEQKADIWTKALPPDLFRKHRDTICQWFHLEAK